MDQEAEALRNEELGSGSRSCSGPEPGEPSLQARRLQSFFFPHFSGFHGAGDLGVLTLKHLVEGLFSA